jgi:glycosidase
MTVPAWVQDAVFYQIFPDRFANGNTHNDPANVQPWGAPPTLWGFQGGDLQGVIQHFDYLRDLGVNALYFNPIFQATSNHRYNTMDYYRVDPKLGSLEDFRTLLDTAHGYGFKVILDGVFNHCGRGFFAFNDVMENREHSPYLDWFHINGLPLDAYEEGQAERYLAWWNLKSLPKFNTTNPEVRTYLLDVARYWIEQGIDGWRLDVPNEIDDDSFWAEFREAVKGLNPQAYLVGEIWTADPRWVGPEHFDGLMLYPLRKALLDLLVERALTPSEFVSKVEALRAVFPPEYNTSHLLLAGSHDTPRIGTLTGDSQVTWLVFFLLFGFPGAPVIFYGDETGLQGGADPECRRAFAWDPDQWDQTLRRRLKSLIDLRLRYATLRQGSYQFCAHDDETGLVLSMRQTNEQVIWQVANTTPRPQLYRLPLHEWGLSTQSQVQALLTERSIPVQEGTVQISLEGYGGEFLLQA